ncbi:MAG: thioesterase family protein [Acidimicrobiales bacterium]
MTVEPGASATTMHTVTEADTAIAMGSGDVAVLGTPRLIAWCEAATVLALAPSLDAAMTTVGYRIRVDHLAPTPVGADVEVRATVADVDGRQVTFDVSVQEGDTVAARGTITRVVVDRQKFLSGLG